MPGGQAGTGARGLGVRRIIKDAGSDGLWHAFCDRALTLFAASAYTCPDANRRLHWPFGEIILLAANRPGSRQTDSDSADIIDLG
jgi:hypothetical protein